MHALSPPKRRYTIEPLEPRLLLAADLTAGFALPSSAELDLPPPYLELTDAGHVESLVPSPDEVDLPSALDLNELADLRSSDDPTREPFLAGANDPEKISPRMELVVIDAGIEDYEQLLADIQERDNGTRYEVVVLDADADGVAALTEILSGYTDLDALHLVSHGSAGAVNLGADRLDLQALQANADAIRGWADAFDEAGDLLIYGCDLAGSADGVSLIDALSQLTEADVAASDDRTGSTLVDGDWDLEHATGNIETGLALSVAAQETFATALATFVVDDFGDSVDVNLGDGLALDAMGKTTLRAAIMEANILPGADLINIPTGTVTLSLAGGSSAAGDLNIAQDLTITGAGAIATQIDANRVDRVFDVASGATLNMSGVTIRGGDAQQGAGIQVDGQLILSDSVVTDNRTTAGTGFGGGLQIKTDGSSATLTNVEISGNTAQEGAGLFATNAANVIATNVTISGNTATDKGGGILARGTASVTITNATIAQNDGSGDTAGVLVEESAGVTIKNTLLFNPLGVNASGAVTSMGFNMENAASFTANTGDQQNVANIATTLGTLQNNGGPTQTHALLTGSLGIDTGTATGAPSDDQRGFGRVGTPDVGAFEFAAIANTAPVLADTVVTLKSLREDAGAPVGAVGDLISDIADLVGGGGLNNVTDPDAGAVTGIAITAADTVNGTWHFSVDNGANWNPLGAVANGSARLLAADGITRVYFEPNANFNGTLGAALTFKAWDQTFGSNGQAAVDTTTGSTAYSAATDSASLTVNPLNDAPVLSIPPLAFINEFHYDNIGVDSGEAVEVAAPAGTDLAGFDLVFYNGFTGLTYRTEPLSGIIPNQVDNFGTLSFSLPANAIQNGDTAPDGIALVDGSGAVLEFLSYEGAFTAADGPASGMTSTDIGVTEDGATPVGDSLQRAGAGPVFGFSAPGANTFGAINTGQSFTAVSQALSETVLEGGTLAFGTATSNAITVSDVDEGELAAADPLTMSLTVGGGTLTLGATAGLLNLVGDGTATITFEGTAAEITTALDGLTYQPTGDFNGSDELTVLVDDQGNSGPPGNLTVVGQVSITVDPVNDEPSFTHGGNQNVNEDSGPHTVAGFATALPGGGADEAGQTFTYNVSNNNAGLFLVAPAIDAAGQLTYSLNPNVSGTATVTVSVRDSGGTANGGDDLSPDQTFDIIVDPINEAPVLDNSGVMTLADVLENDTDPNGTSVATIISSAGGDRITDVDTGALEGIAVIGVDNTDGTWEYSTNGGASFISFVVSGVADGTTDDTAAVLLNEAALIRFVPNPTYTGPAGNISFQAWDQFSGANGDIGVNVSVNGGITAFGTDIETAGLTVVPAGGVLNLLPSAVSGDEDTALVFSTGGGNAIVVGGSTTGDPILRTTLTVTNGTLTLATVAGLNFDAGANGTATMTISGLESAINTALDGLSYDPTGDYSGPANLQVTTDLSADLQGHYTFDTPGDRGNDESPAGANDGTLNGATPLFDATRPGDVLSFDGNDDVQVTGMFGNPADVTLAAWVNLDLGFNFEEAISLGDNVGLRLDTTGIGVEGFFFDGVGFQSTGSSVFINGTGWHHVAFTVDDTASQQIIYIDGVPVTTTANPGAISYTNGANTFLGRHGDGGGGFFSLHGKMDEARIYDRALSAGEISALFQEQTTDTDAISITVNPVNDEPSFTHGGNQNVDEDSGPHTVAGFATALPGGGADEAAQTFTYNVANNNAGLFAVAPTIDASGELTYTLAGNAVGTATVTVSVRDSGATPNGGDDLSPDQTFDIIVAAVNDEPSFTHGGNQNVNEDSGPHTVAGFATALAGGGTDEAAQTFTYNVSNNNAGLFAVGPAIDASGQLTYTLNPNANGTATVTVSVRDSGGTANGGDDLSPDQTFDIIVAAVNDEPSFTHGGNQNVNEDAGAQVVAGFATALPGGGTDEAGQTFTYNVSNNNPGLFLVAPTIDASGQLTYTLNPNISGTATVTVSVRDSGGTANGGDDLSPDQTFDIIVAPRNDAPSGTDATLTTIQDIPRVLTTADFGFWDPLDGNSLLQVEVTTLPLAGVLTNNGVPVVAGSAVSSADIAASRLVFTPGPGATGAGHAAFTFRVQDDGGTAGGGVDLDPIPNLITIDVLAPPTPPPPPPDPPDDGLPAPGPDPDPEVGADDSDPTTDPSPTPQPAPADSTPTDTATLPGPGPAVAPQTVGTPAPVVLEADGSDDAPTLFKLVVAQPRAVGNDPLPEALPVLTPLTPNLAPLVPQSADSSRETFTATRASVVLGLDRLRNAADQENEARAMVLGQSTGAVATLSAGYVSWLLRGGVLLSSVLSSLPAWQFINPLPVFSSMGASTKSEDEDDDSLEAIIEKNTRTDAPMTTEVGDSTEFASESPSPDATTDSLV